jgi:hypothetical protein
VEAPVPVGPDGPAHQNESCVSCKGTATKLKQVDTYGLPPRPVFACVDRELCKTTMIMDNMIAQIRSAP